MDAGILGADSGDNLHVGLNAVLGGAEHFHQRIDVDPVGSDAVLLGLGHDLVKDPQTVGGVLGNAGVVGQQGNDLPALVLGQNGEDLIDLVALAGNGVDQTGLVAELVSLGQHIGAGAVHGDGQVGDGLDAVDHPVQGLDLLSLRHGSAAVDKSRAGIGLGNGTGLDKLRVPLGNGLCHNRNGAVDFFTNNNHCTFSSLEHDVDG